MLWVVIIISDMGLGGSNVERERQEQAEGIRRDLYRRVHGFLAKYKQELADIPGETKMLIKECTALELVEKMDQRKITCIMVLLTFIERAATIGVKNGYVVDQFFEEAVLRARDIDKMRQDNPQKKCWKYGECKQDTFPPFFGVPFSIKDSILLPGKITYCGHAEPVNPIPQSETEFSILTKKMGLIPFVRTSVPQACKTFCTNNNIVGYSKNPWDESRSCNGSSGGEAGLVAAQCSPIGIGSDIANSLRGPADFTGLVTLKPYYRYSNLGSAWTGSYVGGLFLRNQMGVLSRSVDDVVLWNYFMCDKDNYSDIPRKLKDPYLRLNPFRYEVFNKEKKYKIGYFTEFKGEMKCSPSHKRAVFETLKMAEEEGHSTEQIEIEDAQRMFLLVSRMWYGNPDLSLLKEVNQGEKPIREYRQAIKAASLNYSVKSMLVNVILMGEPRWSAFVKSIKPFDVKDYMFMIAQINEFRKKIYAYLQNRQIDMIICPGWYMPAFKLGRAPQFGYCVNFTHIWNCLNYAAGSLPVTVVREGQEYIDDVYKDKIWRDANQNMKGSKGLPVGIQVVSYPGNQEEVLLLMKQLEDKIRFRESNKSKASRENP